MVGTEKTGCMKSELRESAARQATILLSALAASTAYVLALWAMMGNLRDIRSILVGIALLAAPFDLIILLRKSGIRPLAPLFKGTFGSILRRMTIGVMFVAPVLVLAAVMALADAIDQASTVVTKEAIVIAFTLLPIAHLVFIAAQFVRSIFAPNDTP